MKPMYLYVAGALLASAVALPIVVKKQIDTQIEIEKKAMLLSGIDFEVTSESGYFSTLREYNLVITDGEKFRDYALNKFAKNNPNYKGLTKMMQKSTDKDIRPALDGTMFTGTIKTSNLLLEDPFIELSLISLSDDIMSGMSKKKKTYDVVKPMLDEKMITFFITLDSNKKVSKVVMKDIDKTIDKDGEEVNFKLKGHKLNIDITESLAGIYNLDMQSIKAKDFYMQSKDLKYSFDYLTQFENKTDINLGSFELEDSTGKLMLGNTKINSHLQIVNDSTLDVDIGYDINNLSFTMQEKLKFDNFAFKIHAYDIDKDGVMSLNKVYNKVALNPMAMNEDDSVALTDSTQKILNSGFKIDIDTSVRDFYAQDISLKKVDLIFNLKMEPNTYTMNDPEVEKAFIVDGSIVFDANNFQELVMKNKDLEKFKDMGEKDGEDMVFKYQYRDGVWLINGKTL